MKTIEEKQGIWWRVLGEAMNSAVDNRLSKPAEAYGEQLKVNRHPPDTLPDALTPEERLAMHMLAPALTPAFEQYLRLI